MIYPMVGLKLWAETIREVHKKAPSTSVEALIGDFRGHARDLMTVIDSAPDILGA